MGFEIRTNIIKISQRRIIIPGLIILILFAIYMFVAFRETGYPVGIFRAQLTFSAPELQSHFNDLIASGNLNRYQNYHLLDFIFILVYSSVLFITATGLSRQFNNKPRRFGYAIALLFLVAGVLDIIENLLILRMLSEPQTIANCMAIAYSLFALIKLVLFYGGLAWLSIAFIYLAVIKIKKKHRHN